MCNVLPVSFLQKVRKTVALQDMGPDGYIDYIYSFTIVSTATVTELSGRIELI